MDDMKDQSIGFVGAGRMASALARGFVKSGLVTEAAICASDPSAEARRNFSDNLPAATVVEDNGLLLQQSAIVFLAVKPQSLPHVMGGMQAEIEGDTLFVSIVAGVKLSTLSAGLGTDRIVRVMPNTPCLVGLSASGYCAGSGANENDRQRVAQLLESVGIAIPVPEGLLDAVTGLSGSGPAFVYIMIEALSDGGVRMGLPREAATRLAAQTVKGAAEMVLSTGEHPAALKDQVTSPGGTTVAGVQALEQAGLRAALMAAVEAATQRSLELGGS
jgi:pyrroline-5-carboxylate reductase